MVAIKKKRWNVLFGTYISVIVTVWDVSYMYNRDIDRLEGLKQLASLTVEKKGGVERPYRVSDANISLIKR